MLNFLSNPWIFDYVFCIFGCGGCGINFLDIDFVCCVYEVFFAEQPSLERYMQCYQYLL